MSGIGVARFRKNFSLIRAPARPAGRQHVIHVQAAAARRTAIRLERLAATDVTLSDVPRTTPGRLSSTGCRKPRRAISALDHTPGVCAWVDCSSFFVAAALRATAAAFSSASPSFFGFNASSAVFFASVIAALRAVIFCSR